jgi:hypothetical protein
MEQNIINEPNLEIEDLEEDSTMDDMSKKILRNQRNFEIEQEKFKKLNLNPNFIHDNFYSQFDNI